MLRLEKTNDAFIRSGHGRAYGYRLIRDELFPAPINPDSRPSRVPEHEVDAVLSARIAGADDEYIRKLVRQMHKDRLKNLPALKEDSEA
jgi:predicted DNA-binding transcriptional regulator AlpA